MRTLTFILVAASFVGAAPLLAQAADTAAAAVPATQADFVAGALVRASDGAQIGKIVSADAAKVVIDTGEIKIGVQPNLFKKDANGVIMAMTAAQFADAAAKAHARTEAAKAAEQVPEAFRSPAAQQPATPPK